MKILPHESSDPVHTAWSRISKNWIIALVNKFTIVLFIVSLAIVAWRWQSLPPLLPLWYSRPWGTDQLAPPILLLLLPLASIAFYAVNLLVSIYLTAEYLIFTQVLFISSLTVSILSFITLIKILFLVT